MTGRVGKADQALAVPATPANAVDGPPGINPSRKEYRLSAQEHSILKRALLDSVSIRKRLKRP